MKKYLLILLTVTLISSCSDFGDLNVNPKTATAVPAETLFANATKNLSNQMTSTNVNVNIFRLFSQAWTETTYTDEANYDLITRSIPANHWRILYRDVLKDLDETRMILSSLDDGTSAAQRNNQMASISILEVYAYHILVDTFGNVPFTEALDSDNVLPAYDDDTAIYTAINAKLDTAIGMISASTGSFGNSDLIYGGSMDKWKKFGNSLKLRMAVRTGNSTMASEAIASGVMSSNADNATFVYLSGSPNTNPVWASLVESGRKDFIPSNTVVDIMNNLADPRRTEYFDDNMGVGVYIGGTYGDNNTFSDYTHLGNVFHQPETPGILFDYAETEFLLAEAAELGLAGSGAETHYNNAITASFDFWDVADVATYLANADVAYATASSSWQETIATQKWLALFNRGFEAWSTYRMYGYPMMNTPPVSLEPVPRRFTYPVEQATLNGANYTQAGSDMGGDLKSSKVFWDN